MARLEGKLTLKHWLWIWLISARLFAVPWVFGYTFFGALLAGVRDWLSAVGAAVTATCFLLAAHFINNYRDVELGIDRYVDDLEEASRIISSLKPYTAAAWLVPLRITSIEFQRINAMVMIALGTLSYLYLVKPTVFNVIPFVLGVLMAVTYTDWMKAKRLGEVSAFLGHGFSTVTLGYLSQSNDVLTAFLAGIPTGLISALAYSVDQFIDIKTDFVERVRSIYESWFNSRMPLGLYVLIIVVFYFNVLLAWIVAEIYPRGTLLALSIIPIVLYRAPALEWNREEALRDLALTITWLLPTLMCLGTLIK